MKVTIAWVSWRTWIYLRARGTEIARFGISHRRPLAFLGPDGAYVEFPVQEGQVELKLPIDFDQLRVGWEVSRKSLDLFHDLIRFDRGWLYFSNLYPDTAEIRLKAFGARIVDRDPKALDLQVIADLFRIPERLLTQVRRGAKRELDFVYAPAMYRADREKGVRDLVRLLTGAVPPYLWLSSQNPQILPDDDFALVLEAEKLVLLRKETV